ncbi:hypothetical protein EYC84_005143 [Monilinia fructicola]|uniref:PI-PLC Y-box domain-containing protein n=1 Tax=Monilinia fructicola TaxID=38448 RepID=A0A5M9JZH7_MONFR|nr:hypothetical protein EYC84_005143 [Monilinia fructicola]
MDTEVEDIGGNVGGAKGSEISNGGFGRGGNIGLDKDELEEEGWREEPRCIPASKAFAPPKTVVHERAARLAKDRLHKNLKSGAEAPSIVQALKVSAYPVLPVSSSLPAHFAEVDIWKEIMEREVLPKDSENQRMETARTVQTSHASVPSIVPTPQTAAALESPRTSLLHFNEDKYEMRSVATKAHAELAKVTKANFTRNLSASVIQAIDTYDQSLTVAALSPPLSLGSMHADTHIAMVHTKNDEAEREMGQGVNEQMDDTAWEDIHRDVFCDANADLPEGDLGSGGLPHINKRTLQRNERRNEAPELLVSSQDHGIHPVPLSQQHPQKNLISTFSDFNTAFLNPTSSNRQRNEGKEDSNGEVGEKSPGSGIQSQSKHKKRIDASRQVTMALQASLQANGMLPVHISQQTIQDSLPQSLLNPSTATFEPKSTISRQERGREIDGESFASEVVLQKKPRRRASKSLQRAKKRLKAEQEVASPSFQKRVQDTSAQNILKPSTSTLNVNSSNREQRKLEQGTNMEMDGEATVEFLVSGAGLQKNRSIQSKASFEKAKAHQTNMQGEDEKQPADPQQYRSKGQELYGQCLGSEAGLQKKKEKIPGQRSVGRRKASIARFQEQIENEIADTQQNALTEQELHGITDFLSQQVKPNKLTIDGRNHESNDVPQHEKEKAITEEEKLKRILSVPEDIRLSIEQEMGRRQRLSAPNGIRPSTARTVSATSNKIRDGLREKINRRKAAAKQFKEQNSQPHTVSQSQQFVQGSPPPLGGRSLGMPLEHEQEYPHTEKEVGDLFSVPKDIRDIVENAMRKINTVFRDMIEEIRPRISTNIEYLSEETTPRIVPNIISEFSSARKDTVDTMKNGWLEMDANNEDVMDETRPRRIMNDGEHLVAECFTSPESSLHVSPGTFSVTNDTGYFLDNEELEVDIEAEDLVNETIMKSITKFGGSFSTTGDSSDI